MKNNFHGLLNKEGMGGGGGGVEGGKEKKRSSVACLSVDWRLSCPVQTTALQVLQPKIHTSGNKPWFQFGGLTLQPMTHTSGNKPWFQFGGLTLQPKTHTSGNKPWFQFGGLTLNANSNGKRRLQKHP